ncbi:MAG: insulinase family protein, partial [Bacteroidales bacterium]|nr:insulinase family protein [Bacteroidales bacterium]
SKYKKQFIGQLIVNADHNQSEMLSMGKVLLNYGKITPLQEVCRQVAQITSGQLFEVAKEVFSEDRLSVMEYE